MLFFIVVVAEKSYKAPARLLFKTPGAGGATQTFWDMGGGPHPESISQTFHLLSPKKYSGCARQIRRVRPAPLPPPGPKN